MLFGELKRTGLVIKRIEEVRIVRFCDVIDDGKRLVGMITGQGAVGRTPRIIEKLNEIDGVLRVRESKIIKLMED